MSSTSEKTYGSKLANAKSVCVHLKSFAGYQPPSPDHDAAALSAFINGIEADNKQLAENLTAYSAAVEARQQLYIKASDSVEKLMSPIAKAISSVYSKESKEMADVSRLTTGIRGDKPKKSGKKDSIPEEDEVSQSHKSFGSMKQNFADLVSKLSKMDKYKPANKKITIDELNAKLLQLGQTNDDVTAAFGNLKKDKEKRIENYDLLKEKVLRIKDAVSSQYNNNSPEYKLIKGLSV